MADLTTEEKAVKIMDKEVSIWHVTESFFSAFSYSFVNVFSPIINSQAVALSAMKVKESVLAFNANSETTTEAKSNKIETKDDALTVKTASAEENVQEDGCWIGSDDHIYNSMEDSEITETVALENKNKEEKEVREILQPMKLENKEGRK